MADRDRVTFGPIQRWEGEITYRRFTSFRPGDRYVHGLFIANLDLVLGMHAYLTDPDRAETVELAWQDVSDESPYRWSRGNWRCMVAGLDVASGPNRPLATDEIWLDDYDVLPMIRQFHGRHLRIVMRDVFPPIARRTILWEDDEED